MPFPTNPDNDAAVAALADRLCALSIGHTLSYAEASAAVGRDVTGPARHLLARAREVAEKRLGCIFECSRNMGVTRVPPSIAPEIGLSAIRKVRKAANRGRRRLRRIGTNSLTEAETKRVIAYQSMLGAVALVADGNKARTVAAVADPVKPIPPTDILKMFGA